MVILLKRIVYDTFGNILTQIASLERKMVEFTKSYGDKLWNTEYSNIMLDKRIFEGYNSSKRRYNF